MRNVYEPQNKQLMVCADQLRSWLAAHYGQVLRFEARHYADTVEFTGHIYEFRVECVYDRDRQHPRLKVETDIRIDIGCSKRIIVTGNEYAVDAFYSRPDEEESLQLVRLYGGFVLEETEQCTIPRHSAAYPSSSTSWGAFASVPMM